jgi:Protein of unknown function (DUF2785)
MEISMRYSKRPWPSLTIAIATVLLGSHAAAQHDREYWQAVATHHYEVPAGESAAKLSNELSALLASPDSELRDDLAYSILARWIARGVLPDQQLLSLADAWDANLKRGIGETGTNSVLLRSFSALCLASIAEREAKKRFLGESKYHQLVADGIAYLQTERDLRGYDAQLGWIHATAHTADLLQALAGNRMLTSEEGRSILSAIAVRLSSASEVFSQGEQDRLAQTLLAVLRRDDFKMSVFEDWLSHLRDDDKNVWQHPLTPASLAVYQNHTYLLQALVVHLELEPDSERTISARRQVLEILRTR